MPCLDEFPPLSPTTIHYLPPQRLSTEKKRRSSHGLWGKGLELLRLEGLVPSFHPKSLNSFLTMLGFTIFLSCERWAGTLKAGRVFASPPVPDQHCKGEGQSWEKGSRHLLTPGQLSSLHWPSPTHSTVNSFSSGFCRLGRKTCPWTTAAWPYPVTQTSWTHGR